MIPYILASLFSVTLPEISPVFAPTVIQSVQIAEKVPEVPFYSQFGDISSPKWRKVACGVTALAMIINYYETDATSPDTLLQQGIDDGAYVSGAGWSHQGLALLSEKYGFEGKPHDLSGSAGTIAFAKFKELLKDGPAIVSVHYKMDPKNPIPHLVVINGIDGETLYYNDPAAREPKKEISAENFQKAWKKRFIIIRPAEEEK
jgi:ABC-type bacteriocin/lantibiotic exporter with double-glycine peptidase domain